VSRFPLAPVTLLMTVACGSSPMGGTPPPPPPSANTISLPVRVHVVSSRIGQIDSGLSDAEVQALFGRANEVWAQADVRWVLESIAREPALMEDELEAAIQGTAPLTADLLLSVLPQSNLLAGGWDVFLVNDLTAVAGFPGIFFPSLPGMIASEVDPAGIGDPGRILAHELGHSLTLQHVNCTQEGNLMAPGCASTDRTRLTASQVAAARGQAELGTPIRN